jgi:hypothetical protein
VSARRDSTPVKRAFTGTLSRSDVNSILRLLHLQIKIRIKFSGLRKMHRQLISRKAIILHVVSLSLRQLPVSDIISVGSKIPS